MKKIARCRLRIPNYHLSRVGPKLVEKKNYYFVRPEAKRIDSDF